MQQKHEQCMDAQRNQPERCLECEETRRPGTRSTDPSHPGVDRRQFVARSAIGTLGVLLAAACGGGSDTTGPGPSAPTSLAVQVSNFPALASVGGIARVDSGIGTPVAAVRTGPDTFAAFSLICPHFGCTVGVGGTSFACPCHGARFSANGHWTGGQPTSNLTQLNVSYDPSSGTLTITG